MKFKNMKISLIALLTGVISLTSLGEVYAGEKDDLSGSGKIARPEGSSRGEISGPEKAGSIRARAEKMFSVYRTKKDGSTKVVDNETQTRVKIDTQTGKMSGTSALIGVELLSHVSLEKMKKVEVTAEVDSGYAPYLKKEGLTGAVNAAGNLEISAKGLKAMDLLNTLCVIENGAIVEAEQKDLELGRGLWHFKAHGFDPDSIKKLEQAAGDPDLKSNLAATQGFYKTFSPETKYDISENFADKAPYADGENAKLHKEDEKPFTIDETRRLIYMNYTARFEPLYAKLKEEKIDMAVAVAMKEADFEKLSGRVKYLPTIKQPGQDQVLIMLPGANSDRDDWVAQLKAIDASFGYVVGVSTLGGFQRAKSVINKDVVEAPLFDAMAVQK